MLRITQVLQSWALLLLYQQHRPPDRTYGGLSSSQAAVLLRAWAEPGCILEGNTELDDKPVVGA